MWRQLTVQSSLRKRMNITSRTGKEMQQQVGFVGGLLVLMRRA
jgi:hypothetical protein